ncbi:helix-turn-helix domain-containing protein [Umezawaea endophytica]|uniref:Helix-turn-helix domain-containing protein n=1 Tax=Umezawaea endophytica TaxID=1654476 RepID=A0A9X2VKV8_9PSEU|nr:helix-turn-helix transcriptional regulator [Umezawaea endophytica]MCS7478407.1 helix-turn-helix domain-containing protein [Umezawaea endophytica]
METEDKPPARVTTAQSRELGQELRQARKRGGLRGAAFCDELEWSTAKLSKLEKGWRGTSDWEIGTFLGKSGADKATRERVMRLAQEPDIGYFVRRHTGITSDGLLCMVMHQRSALTLTSYDTMVIPGLLQSVGYARALLETTGAHDFVDDVMSERLDRQEHLRSQEGARSTFYLHEAALRLVVGGSRTMHDQMMRLAFMCKWPHVTLRVVPFTAPGHPALRYPSALMTFTRHAKPVAYAESDLTTVFLEEEGALAFYRDKHAVLDGLALSEEESHDVFTHWANVYDDEEGRGRATSG